MRTACWIPKATNTHSQYVRLIAFPRQQWLHERSSMSRHTYTTCLAPSDRQPSLRFICQYVHFTRNLYLSLSLLLWFYGRGKLSYLIIITSRKQFLLYRKSVFCQAGCEARLVERHQCLVRTCYLHAEGTTPFYSANGSSIFLRNVSTYPSE